MSGLVARVANVQLQLEQRELLAVRLHFEFNHLEDSEGMSVEKWAYEGAPLAH